MEFADRLSLHTWTLHTTALPEFLDVAREAGFAAVELRNIDFQNRRDAGMTNEAVLDLIGSSGVAVSTLGSEWGVLFAQGDEWKRMRESLELTFANAHALGCHCVMVSPGLNEPTSIEHAAENFRAGGEIAARYGIQYALEFNSRHALVNSLPVARRILELADHPSCGILLDAYHLHFSGAGADGFADVPAEDIFAFQLSDAPPGPPSQVRVATDRLPPGEGVIPWLEVFRLLAAKDYGGYLDYEVPNPAQWERPPLEVARDGLERTRRLIEAAFAE